MTLSKMYDKKIKDADSQATKGNYGTADNAEPGSDWMQSVR